MTRHTTNMLRGGGAINSTLEVSNASELLPLRAAESERTDVLDFDDSVGDFT